MRSLALCSILMLSLAACGGGGGDSATTGSLKVMVTDAPFPADLIESATVVIERVEARNADLDGWQTLFPPPAPEGEDGEPPAEPAPAPTAEIDLIPLTGGVSELLIEIEVPVGTYNEVRLIVQAGTVVLSEEAHVVSAEEWPASHTFSTENGKLRFPSGAQTGIKVKIENDIVVSSQLSDLELEPATLTLDFDLPKNFVFNGTPDSAPGVKRINFTPVVRATNATENGSISLHVDSDVPTNDAGDDYRLPFPTVDVFAVTEDEITLDRLETKVTTTTGNEFGDVVVSLVPGVYRFDVMARGYETYATPDYTVVLGNLTTAAPVTLTTAAFWLEGQVLSDMGTPVSEPSSGTETDDDMGIDGATVTVWASGADPEATPPAVPLATPTTDASGGWFVTGLTVGTYDVRVTAAGHDDSAVLVVTVADSGPTPLNVTLVQTTP